MQFSRSLTEKLCPVPNQGVTPSISLGLFVRFRHVSRSCSIFLYLAVLNSVFRFRKLNQLCQITAKKPENINRYWGPINAKLKAVTAGQNLTEFHMLVGTAAFTLSTTPEGLSPLRIACMLKKYVLKTGVKTDCWTTTLAAMEREREA